MPSRTDLDPDLVAQEQARLDSMWDELKAGAVPTVFQDYGYIPAKPGLRALFTSMFLHAGWLHLLGNMLFLWLAGGSLEDRWGRILYAVFYLASGVVAALAHAAVNPQSSAPMVGASGAIAGLMGAFLVRLSLTRIRFFYWFLVVRGTFVMPAYVALPLWLLEQFAVARFGIAGGIAVWAHIGGFVFGVLVALVLMLTDFEKNILAPAIARKTTWSPSERLSTALGKLDRGDVDGGIQDLIALLKQSPNNIEGRAALVGAYAQKGDAAAAGRESARLVSAYVVARDPDGGLAALEEHRRAHPEVPVALRSLLTLAAHREKQDRHREAADLYHKAIQDWPNDPLAPKALIAYGRLMLEVFQQPDDTLAILEKAVANPQTTPEFRRAAEELGAAARRAKGTATDAQGASSPATAEFEPTSLTVEPSEPSPPESFSPPAVPTPSFEAESPVPALQEEPAPAAETASPAAEPEPVAAATEVLPSGPAADAIPAPPPTWKLLPVSMRAVNIDARGLHLQNREGKAGHLPWQTIAGVSVARIGHPEANDQSADGLILDLLTSPRPMADGNAVRCVRLSVADLALPQLQAEPSPVRGLQRLVATVLKAAGATAYPTRDDCLGARGFPAFPDLASYETALVACLRLTAM
jgi:membrane associated rhomboid family serine protease